jgi:hypothetical protein
MGNLITNAMQICNAEYQLRAKRSELDSVMRNLEYEAPRTVHPIVLPYLSKVLAVLFL